MLIANAMVGLSALLTLTVGSAIGATDPTLNAIK